MNISTFKSRNLPDLQGKTSSPELDLDLIIALSLQKDRAFLYTHPEQAMSDKETRKAKKLISKRQQGYPLAYLLGHQEFMGLDFRVNHHTLVPRPETELMVEEILEDIKDDTLVIDVGTGSGAIIISLAKLSKVQGVNFAATDISLGALCQARKNAKSHQMGIDFYWRDLVKLFPWKKYADCKNLIIAANLPYVSMDIYRQAKTIQREPKQALISGERGLRHYRRLFKQLRNIPTSFAEASVYCEINPEQATIFGKQCNVHGLGMEVKKDLAGKERLIKITLR